MKKIYFFIFFIYAFSFGEVYIPRNNNEKKTLDNLRKKEFTIGIFNEDPYNVNYFLKDLLSNYLKLNINYKTITNSHLESILNEIDGIGIINKTDSLNNQFIFTNTILEKSLFIVSQEKNIKKISDLDNQSIYISTNELYENLFKNILNTYNVNTSLIKVDNLNFYKNEFILTSYPELYNINKGFKIPLINGASLGLKFKFKELIPFINRALDLKYRKLINSHILNLNKKIIKNNFFLTLNDDEKKYLEQHKILKVAYDNNLNSVIAYYSTYNNKYSGIAPNLLEDISDLINLELISTSIQANKYYNLFNIKNDIDIFLSINNKNNLILSNCIYDLPIKIITLKKSNNNTNNKIGVLKNSFVDKIVHLYETNENIATFDSTDDLFRSLNNKSIGLILSADDVHFNSDDYNVDLFKSVPIKFSFNNDNEILKNIINKAEKYLNNKDEIIRSAINERILENRQALIKNKKTKQITYLMLGILILLLILTYFKNKMNKNMKLKDPLTSLPNRFAFDKFCKNNNFQGCCFIVDLNNFKNINDTLGHKIGDLILKEFSKLLLTQFKNTYFFRISGDEFYGFSLEKSEYITFIFENLKKYNPFFKNNNISFSVGLCLKDLNLTTLEAFKYADLALFEIQKSKLEFYKIATNDFILKKHRELTILKNLQDNLDGIHSVFQPKICLKTNRIIGAEALARYTSKELGVISPMEFIPISETNNFVTEIDFKIIEESFIFVKSQLNSNLSLDNFKISFNLSIETFNNCDFIKRIEELLKKYNISGYHFEAEITESIFISNTDIIIEKLHVLKKLGFEVSIDDFTAGHCTARLLPLLPIDTIKFDKSLLDSIKENKDKGMVVYKHLFLLMKELNLKVVAEGVESKNQLNYLKELGVTFAQGYYISKPLSNKVTSIFLATELSNSTQNK
ncbi:MAG: EAL domain-containing protein [Cetobacterium sp.]